MIYRFKLVSDEVNNFVREIEIDSESTFLELRNAILDSVGFSKDGMDSFIICDVDWSRGEEITLEDMGSSSDSDIWLMRDTPISEFIEYEGQRLMFIFDYITDRAFFMEMKESRPGCSLEEPVCTLSKGVPPRQSVDLDEFEKSLDAAAAASTGSDLGIFDDDFGGGGYNDDDFLGMENIGAEDL